jgi:hypothetical protein
MTDVLIAITYQLYVRNSGQWQPAKGTDLDVLAALAAADTDKAVEYHNDLGLQKDSLQDHVASLSFPELPAGTFYAVHLQDPIDSKWNPDTGNWTPVVTGASLSFALLLPSGGETTPDTARLFLNVATANLG